MLSHTQIIVHNQYIMVMENTKVEILDKGEPSGLVPNRYRRILPKQMRISPRLRSALAARDDLSNDDDNQTVLAKAPSRREIEKPVAKGKVDFVAYTEAALNKGNVPAEILAHMRADKAVIFETANIREIGIGGGFDAVDQMVIADYTQHAARGPYEVAQGMIDNGFLESKNPGWKRPSIEIDKQDSQETFTGEQTFDGAKAIVGRNMGVLRKNSLTVLRRDTELYARKANGRPKMGGFGQGLKIHLCTAVSTPQDRRNVVKVFLREAKWNAWQREDLERYVASPAPSPEHASFAYVQARDPDTNTYYRAYAYREPTMANGVEIWNLKYVFVDIDENNLPEEDKDMVVCAHVNPDNEQISAWNDAPWNILQMNPYYPSEESLVRTDNDARPTAAISRYYATELAELPEAHDSTWDVEEIDWPEGVAIPRRIFPGIHVEGLRLRVKNDNWDGSAIRTWNINPRGDTTLLKRIHRENDSVHVDGDTKPIFSACVMSRKDLNQWKDLMERVLNAQSETRVSQLLEVQALRDYYLLSSTARQALIDAFHEVAPHAEQSFYSDTTLLAVWRAKTGKDKVAPARVDPALSSTLRRAELTDCDSIARACLTEGTGLSNWHESRIEVHDISTTADNVKRNNKSPGKQIVENILGERGERLFPGVTTYARINADTIEIAISGLVDSRNRPYTTFLEPEKEGNTEYVIKNDASELLSSLGKGGVNTNIFFQSDTPNFGVGVKCLTVKRVGAKTFGVIGESNQSLGQVVPTRGIVIQFKGTSAAIDGLTKDLDGYFTKLNPMVIKHTDAALKIVDEQLRYLKEQCESTKNELETIRRNALGNLADGQTLRPSVRARHAGRQGVGGGARGEYSIEVADTNRSIWLPGASEETIIYTPHDATSWIEGSETRDHAPRIHFRVTEVGGDSGHKLPNNISISTSSNISFDEWGNATGKREESLFRFVGEVNGESVWRTSGARADYFRNRTDAFGALYTSVITFEEPLEIANGDARILPIPENWEVTMIQLPEATTEIAKLRDGQLTVPLLFRDMVSGHTVLQRRSELGKTVISTLPAGTRIYIRPMATKVRNQDKNFLEQNFPLYLEKCKEPIANFDKLDHEARQLITIINELGYMTNEQRAEAIDEFWRRRRLYDDTVRMTSIEEIIRTGKGTCSAAAMGELALMREAGIPCRIKQNYSYKTKGALSPPYHVTIEIMGSEGNWIEIDPPNGKMSRYFASLVAENACNDRLPAIHGVRSLAMSQTEQISHTGVPEIVKQFIAHTTQEEEGVKISDTLRSIFTAVREGSEKSMTNVGPQLVTELSKLIIESNKNLKHLSQPSDIPPEDLALLGKNIATELHEYMRLTAYALPEVPRDIQLAAGARWFAGRLATLLIGEKADIYRDRLPQVGAINRPKKTFNAMKQLLTRYSFEEVLAVIHSAIKHPSSIEIITEVLQNESRIHQAERTSSAMRVTRALIDVDVDDQS